jgi:anti-sigma B factor antagonist
MIELWDKKMIITKTLDGNNITLSIVGRLDTITSVELSNELDKIFAEGAFNFILDLKGLDYISSAGLRILLVTQKQVTLKGTKLELTGVNETVKSVLDMTGFSGILTIK